ncbi:right-handed parallel beta-helix repeat-containing protein [Streptomyces sp. NBC_01304]|uniref:right-handed parallel beta-helix repeat-containing protein n=1 Tax=Streptomyces sp. NBC_01304 TaxID=2903818 RepID=UPI002E0E0E94|nr:right-handed parallel beta-helix repeat-containing protein [Streptomyces sp. NBC_01304]
MPHPRIRRAALLAAGLLPLALAGTLAGPAAEAAEAPVTYYVDCSAPTPGTGSRAAPLNSLPAVNALTLHAGDTVLFKRGTRCKGQLHARFAGTADSPITYGAYGTGAKPHLDANGNYAAVWLKNAPYNHIRDLELTAPGDNTTARRGVWLQAVDSGDVAGVVLERLDIHDVRGVLPAATGGFHGNGKYAGASGGIIVEALGTQTPSAFTDLTIRQNSIRGVDRAGIYFWSNWARRPDLATFWNSLATADWHPHRNVRIEDNKLADIGGDGLVVKTSRDVLVQRNTLDGFNERAGSVNAGMWTANSDHVTFQFNRSSGGNTDKDGQGYDVDHSTNHVTFQYNVSSDNDGGFFLLCPYGADVPGNAKDFVIRYNLSVNDRTRTFQVCSGGLQRGKIYHNTIQLPDVPAGTTHQIVTENATKAGALDVLFANNILRGGATSGTLAWTLDDPSFRIDRNVLYGVPVPATATGTLTSAPLLTKPGTGTDAPADYRLLPGSPATGAGAAIADNGGRDFFGTPIATPPSIGFHEPAGGR